MPQTSNVSIENNFSGGLKTEFTGLNFPEHSCTETYNCVFGLTGNVERRKGIDFETNFTYITAPRDAYAISTYKWDNAGGDGNTQIFVVQIGTTLYFYKTTAATSTSPASHQQINIGIALSTFSPSTGGSVNEIECQFTDGNGYLFVFHPHLEPFYCIYSAADETITATQIIVQIRDFVGIKETLPDTTRPSSLTHEHQYNLQNQGWSAAPAWNVSSNTLNPGLTVGGTATFTVDSTTAPATVGQSLFIQGGIRVQPSHGAAITYPYTISGTLVSYVGNLMTVTIATLVGQTFSGTVEDAIWYIMPGSSGNYTSTWHAAVGNYPSNADVWWRYKNTSGVFDPVTTVVNKTLTSPAPKGAYILDAFNQLQSSVSGVPGLNQIVSTERPSTGAWFQGRIWFTGISESIAHGGSTYDLFYTWTENIYFSQIIEKVEQFGKCYQMNDPTAEDLRDLLPSDGGVINIQGSGKIYKLFPIQNGLLVFAANGIWFITGSQGIGFTANDYTVVKISNVHAISSNSFVNVLGLPIFWNEEGIYAVEQAQQGLGMTVNAITSGTILSFYSDIPTISKKYVKAAYDPINYMVQWIYRTTAESNSDVTARYEYDGFLSFNTLKKSFSPGTISGTPKIHSINYISNPGGGDTPEPQFKYYCSWVIGDNNYAFTFADEHDTRYLDWFSYDNTGVDYESYFVTGYQLKGQAIRMWQPQYVNIFSDNSVDNGYKIQGIWDYASSGNSGKYSSVQVFNNVAPYFDKLYRRVKIRGHGLSLQLKIRSLSGKPFNIMGWSVWETINQGI